ncbi:hypothetical protein [Pedobacter sp. SYSU D00535]|uniref:hypothetical protein n=1 Tax=Pedobacter sp. SYSU D00535 TaxID=2810308 RepID=UPI001A976C24|nr:hypothetical protein [Pedobacter sp. SYSU D00535]
MDKLDWGIVTPEGTRLERNEFIYVYNHDLSSAEKLNRTLRFILGRLRYYDTQLPPNPKHLVKIDLRGQSVPKNTTDLLKMELNNQYPGNLTISFIVD